MNETTEIVKMSSVPKLIYKLNTVLIFGQNGCSKTYGTIQANKEVNFEEKIEEYSLKTLKHGTEMQNSPHVRNNRLSVKNRKLSNTSKYREFDKAEKKKLIPNINNVTYKVEFQVYQSPKC